MKIIRACINGINVYTADTNGKAEVPTYLFEMYKSALDNIAAFEQEVDKQYETQSSSSAPTAR